MPKEFKDKLKEKRNELGLSQQRLADQLFVSRSAVAKWENGLGYPSADCREQIRRIFEVEDNFFTADEPEEILCEKNRKLRRFRITSYILYGVYALVALPLLALFVAYLFGYRMTLSEVLISDSSESYVIRFAEGEYIFDCLAWDIANENSAAPGKMLSSVNVIRKKGFLYRNELDNPELVKRYWMKGPDGKDVAILTCVHGKNADYWFIDWVEIIRSLDESGGKTQYRMLTDRVTVNGEEITLRYYSYFSLKGKLNTISVDGTEMTVTAFN
ncbi:MAG: helix-turn-helix transcriptional regulator [Lachnospiraceae bacterium]|nr:helix-turn-helix transcriptional regulator [Lachnospiraceae bacterium]